jgi:hypothetical protein
VRRLLAGGAVCVALAAGAASASSHVTAATTCVTLTYLSLLDAADGALATAPPEPAAALTALTRAEDLAPSASIVLAPIISGLASSPPDVATTAPRLDLLAKTLALPAGSACNDPSQAAHNLLRNVYSSSVFADLDHNPTPSLFERIGAAINWVISHILGLLGSGGSIVVGLLVLAVIVAFVAYRVRGMLGGRRATPGEEPHTAGDDPDREWQRGLAAAQRGDHREAIRRAFRSALLEVGGRRAHLNRAWTTREMLGSLAADAELLAVLAPAADAFDRAWYGSEPVGASEWDLARTRCEGVRRVARHAPAEEIA